MVILKGGFWVRVRGGHVSPPLRGGCEREPLAREVREPRVTFVCKGFVSRVSLREGVGCFGPREPLRDLFCGLADGRLGALADGVLRVSASGFGGVR